MVEGVCRGVEWYQHHSEVRPTMASDARGVVGPGVSVLVSVRMGLSLNIAVKELIPIVLQSGVHTGKVICAHCDNSAVAAVLQSRSSMEKDLMQMLRYLFFFEAFYQFQITFQHIP